MKMKTTILSATALCLGLVASAAISSNVAVPSKPLIITLTTANLPTTLACNRGGSGGTSFLTGTAYKGRPAHIVIPTGTNSLKCNYWVKKGTMQVLVTKFGFRVKGDKKVKINSKGLPQSDNSKMIYQVSGIHWGSGVRIHFISYGVKTKYSTYRKPQ